MVLLSIFFTRIRSTEGSSADCSLFILSTLALTIQNITQIFLYEDLSIVTLHTHLSVVFPPECQQDRTLLRKLALLSENILIFDINHQQKTQVEVRPD